MLRTDEGILRYYLLKVPSATEKFNSRSYKNPYLDVAKPASTPSV
jgi:hypothetical protein